MVSIVTCLFPGHLTLKRLYMYGCGGWGVGCERIVSVEGWGSGGSGGSEYGVSMKANHPLFSQV